ncbi:hypothetical protein ACRALDRAFT_212279 [Sodiomyces alcalophilus JCM 7366]|uniref:uncharacterized protein n=1 Tax=Sodiomyces alcalophilus JCM 7366 TaxID=591952 RepID=UPI0039B68B0F
MLAFLSSFRRGRAMLRVIKTGWAMWRHHIWGVGLTKGEDDDKAVSHLTWLIKIHSHDIYFRHAIPQYSFFRNLASSFPYLSVSFCISVPSSRPDHAHPKSLNSVTHTLSIRTN